MTTTTSTTNQNPIPSPERAPVVEGARDDLLCVPGSTEGAGALVWWRLQGARAYAAISDAWVAAGLPADDCPPPTSPSLALRLAVIAVAKKRIRRPLDGGWIIGEDEEEEKEAEPTEAEPTKSPQKEWHGNELCRVWLDALPAPGTTPECRWTGDDAIGMRVRAQYEAALVDCVTAVVSVWLPAYLRSRCGAIPVRDKGGVYYVPPTGLELLRNMRTVLGSVAKLDLVGVVRAEEAIEAILGALAADTDAAIDAALASADTKRKAERRVAIVQAMRDRLEQYETLLGARHADLGERIDKAERALSLIALGDAAPATE